MASLLKTLQLEGGSSTQIKFSVKGDLNADELAAITSVIDQAGALAEDFFAGDLQSAFESAAAMTIDGQQLTKVGLKMQVREQFTYSQQDLLPGIGVPAVAQDPNVVPAASETAASAPAALSTPTATAAAQPPTTNPPSTASTGGEVAAPVPSVVSSSAVAAELAVDASAAEPVAATEDTLDTAEVVPAPQTSSLSALMSDSLRSISDFLTKLVGSLNELQTTPDDSAQSQDSTASVSLSLKLKICESMLISASATTLVNEAQDLFAETPDSTDADPQVLPALVSDTLDALAANQQPALEVTA